MQFQKCCAAAIFLAGAAHGQSLAFDAATIKPSDPNANHLTGDIRIYPGGRLLMPYVTLKSLIITAFNASYWQVSGGESWVDKDYYDLEAKPPANLKPPITDLRHTWTAVEDPQLRSMLQTLLIDRFHLRFHRETKTGTVYVIERGDKPLKLRPTGNEEEHAKLNGDTNFSGNLGFVGGRWNVYNSTVAQIAKFASDYYLHAPVLDRTNLEGAFDYKEPGGDDPDANYDDPIQGLFPKLGLKLERTTGPVEMFVIDHAEKPSAN